MTDSAQKSGLSIVRKTEWVEAHNWIRLVQYRQDTARQILFGNYLPFAKKIARDQFFKRRNDNFELTDLEQLAIEALLDSIDHFNPSARSNFTSFCRPRILGNIADGVARMSEAGRQAQHLRKVEKDRLASLQHRRRQNETATVDDLRELVAGLALGIMLEGTGLYDNENGRSKAPNGYESLEWKNTVNRLIQEYERLPDPEPFIIKQHYQNGISFTQIAQLLGLTKGRISQLHRKALSLLKTRLGKF